MRSSARKARFEWIKKLLIGDDPYRKRQLWPRAVVRESMLLVGASTSFQVVTTARLSTQGAVLTKLL